jgi:hypothetical protein
VEATGTLLFVGCWSSVAHVVVVDVVSMVQFDFDFGTVRMVPPFWESTILVGRHFGLLWLLFLFGGSSPWVMCVLLYGGLLLIDRFLFVDVCFPFPFLILGRTGSFGRLEGGVCSPETAAVWERHCSSVPIGSNYAYVAFAADYSGGNCNMSNVTTHTLRGDWSISELTTANVRR